MACGWFASPAGAGLLSFPVAANQRKTVTCLESPTLSYDVYLPPAYSTNGPPLPILYTLNPSGGGMVSTFQTVCSRLNIILIGLRGPSNSSAEDVIYRESYAVSRDLRRRVLYDPTAELVAGFSGGGQYSYLFSRIRAQHVAGVLAMGGWLGVSNVGQYQTTHRVQTNLLVVRTTGLSDTAALYYLPADSNYLASCGAVVHDWYFSGGHQAAPDSEKTNSLNWLLDQRIKPGPNDQSASEVRAADWRSRLPGGQRESVLRECVRTLMDRPRSWEAYQAQLLLDDLAMDDAAFRTLEVGNLSQGDFDSDLFYFLARGAAPAQDLARYRAYLKALTGITGTNGDRVADIHALLAQFGYPAPLLQSVFNPQVGLVTLWIRKDAPGLNYFVESRANFGSGVWQSAPVSVMDLDTAWYSLLPYQPGPATGFYRVRTALP